jgi:hypothetical protein
VDERITVKIDPNNTWLTQGPEGLLVQIPAAIPVTHSMSWDGLTNTLTTIVDDQAWSVNLGSLDNEGVTLEFSGGNLILKNRAGVVLSTSPIPDLDAQQLSIAGNVISLTGGGTVTLPAAPPTTNTATWTKIGGIVDVVDGISAAISVPVGTPTDLIGYSASGTPVNTPIVRTARLREEYKAVAVTGTHVVTGPIANGLFLDDYFISSLIEITAAGVTYTLPVIPAALSLDMVGIEIDVKALGAWSGPVVVLPGAGTIDGQSSHTFQKTLAASPSRSFRWTGAKWLIV